jgi:hypothetical protein
LVVEQKQTPLFIEIGDAYEERKDAELYAVRVNNPCIDKRKRCSIQTVVGTVHSITEMGFVSLWQSLTMFAIRARIKWVSLEVAFV